MISALDSFATFCISTFKFNLLREQIGRTRKFADADRKENSFEVLSDLILEWYSHLKNIY